jgi:hypothetical protein
LRRTEPFISKELMQQNQSNTTAAFPQIKRNFFDGKRLRFQKIWISSTSELKQLLLPKINKLFRLFAPIISNKLKHEHHWTFTAAFTDKKETFLTVNAFKLHWTKTVAITLKKVTFLTFSDLFFKKVEAAAPPNYNCGFSPKKRI